MRQTIASCLLLIATTTLFAAPPAASPAEGVRDTGRHAEVRKPTRGMTMNNVRDVFGEPRRRIPPVGDPPISRWEYDGFTVYFEYHLVLHSVTHS
jgi:hypothetical protein